MPRPVEFIAPSSGPKSIDEAVAPEQAFHTHHKAWEKVSSLLVTGEHIEHMVVQGMSSLKWHPGVLALTNRRVIMATPRWWSLKFTDMPWRLLNDAHLVEGPLGAKLTIYGGHGVRFELGHLPKAAARRAYAFAQSLEEPVVEFRRQRLLEETRAAARGVAVEAYSPGPAGTGSTSPTPTPSEALATLKELLDSGLIEQGEYDAKRAEVLSRL